MALALRACVQEVNCQCCKRAGGLHAIHLVEPLVGFEQGDEDRVKRQERQNLRLSLCRGFHLGLFIDHAFLQRFQIGLRLLLKLAGVNFCERRCPITVELR